MTSFKCSLFLVFVSLCVSPRFLPVSALVPQKHSASVSEAPRSKPRFLAHSSSAVEKDFLFCRTYPSNFTSIVSTNLCSSKATEFIVKSHLAYFQKCFRFAPLPVTPFTHRNSLISVSTRLQINKKNAYGCNFFFGKAGSRSRRRGRMEVKFIIKKEEREMMRVYLRKDLIG